MIEGLIILALCIYALYAQNDNRQHAHEIMVPVYKYWHEAGA